VTVGTTDPDQVPPLRWGMIGTGWIADRFASDLRLLPGAEVVAVGSRAQAGADVFADLHQIAHRHPSYEALVADDNVQAVYVSTPHPGHHDAALAAIQAGKHVLCEKPFTMDAAQAGSLVDAARTQGVFLMEAMWTRFLPHVVQMRSEIASGRLGDLRMVIADHTQWFAPDPAHRLFAPGLGGGALLDLGIYPVSFSSMVFGTPTRITAVSDPAFTGVDAQTSMVLQHEGGRQSVLTTSLEVAGPNRASVMGTDARIEIESYWLGPSRFILTPREGDPEVFAPDEPGNGLRHQAAEVARCIAAGARESTVMPLDETVAIMRTMDEVRRQINLTYPGEAGPPS
jgi:predicted dehydrogenase